MTDENKNILKKGQELVDDVFGSFSNRQDYTEDKNGNITRKLKVGGKKVEITSYKTEDGTYFTRDLELNEKQQKKLKEKIEKGKELSDDEKLYLNLTDRLAVAYGMTVCKYTPEEVGEAVSCSKEEIIGQTPIGDFTPDFTMMHLDMDDLANNIKKSMIRLYGEELGTKRFEELMARSTSGQEQERSAQGAEAQQEELAGITRELEVCGQKVKLEAAKPIDGKYYVDSLGSLDDENKTQLMAKIEKGEKLSDDEKLWLDIADRTIVEIGLSKLGVDGKQVLSTIGYTKEEITGQTPVGDFGIDLSQYPADKVATLLENIKQTMIQFYGDELGTKRFEEFMTRSNAGQEKEVLTKVEEEEKIDEPTFETVTEEVKIEEEQPAVVPAVEGEIRMSPEDREEIKDEMRRDADAHNGAIVEAEPIRTSVKEDMHDDAIVAKTRILMGRSGVKMQNKDETLNKLVENFGAEAAYQLVLKSMLEPANVMNAMGEDFKRSGASIEYLASIDPNDAEKMAKIAELSGVAVENMPVMAKKNPENETVSEALAPEMMKAKAVELNLDTLKIQPEIELPETIKLPSQAEIKYSQLAGEAEQVKIGDLEQAGVNLKTDVQPTLKMLGKDNPEKISELAPNGLGDKDAVVSKEFAVALIERAQAREQLALLQRYNRGR